MKVNLSNNAHYKAKAHAKHLNSTLDEAVSVMVLSHGKAVNGNINKRKVIARLNARIAELESMLTEVEQ